MTITYHGDACVRLTGRTAAGEFTVLTDPYDAKATGLKAIRPGAVDVVVSTTGQFPPFEGPAFRITSPGEYEVKGVAVTGIAVGATMIYRIEAEGLHVAHLGHLSQPLVAEVIDRLGDIDVCLVPIGGHGVLTGKQAADLLEEVEPRLAIPIQYRIAGARLPYDGPEAFCKGVGCATKPTDERMKVAEKDLPTEEMWVRLLAVET